VGEGDADPDGDANGDGSAASFVHPDRPKASVTADAASTCDERTKDTDATPERQPLGTPDPVFAR
jgi:hypothetical protein